MRNAGALSVESRIFLNVLKNNLRRGCGGKDMFKENVLLLMTRYLTRE
jgi:hypothetical protein